MLFLTLGKILYFDESKSKKNYTLGKKLSCSKFKIIIIKVRDFKERKKVTLTLSLSNKMDILSTYKNYRREICKQNCHGTQ